MAGSTRRVQIVPNEAVYFGKPLSGGNDYDLFCLFTPTCQLTGSIKTNGVENFLGTGINPPANTWSHVALTYDGATMTVYFNGVAVASQAVTGNIDDSGQSFDIAGGDGLNFVGLIDEVEVFNRALSGAEILSIYNAGCTGKCHSCTPPPANMIGWWPGDGNTKDIQGGNNGLLENGATFATGEVGQAFSLNGSNQYVTIPDSPALRPANVSVDGWFNFSSNSGVIVLFAKPVGTGLQDSYQVFLNGGVLSAGIGDSTSSDLATSSFTPTPGTWYHIALTYDGSTLTLYVNDEVVASAATSRTIGYDGHAFLIGADSNNEQVSFFFPGLIDEVEIFDRALSADEIQSIYDAGSHGKCKPTCLAPPSGLIDWWPGDNTAADIEGNNNGTLKNGATFDNGKVDRAFGFNGSNQYVDVGLVDLPNTFSIDAWVNPNDTSTSPVIVGNDDAVNGYLFEILSGGALYASVDNSGSVTQAFTNSSLVTTGSWHHVVVTYDGSAFEFYVDGLAANPAFTSGSGGAPGSSSASAKIGIFPPTANTNQFNGRIDEVELFNRVLTAQEAADLYSAGSAGKCKTVRFYVSNAAWIEKFDINGVDLGTFADSGLDEPWGLAFDFSGNLYVANLHNNTIEKFDPRGTGTQVQRLQRASRECPVGSTLSTLMAIFTRRTPATNTVIEFTSAGTDQAVFGSAVLSRAACD